MSTHLNPSANRKLNPFVFPSETNLRFVLLVVAALLLTFNEGINLGYEILKVDSPAFPSTDIDLLDPLAVEQGLMEWNSAFIQSLRLLIVPLIMVFSVLLLATVIYRSHAARIRRHQKLRVVTRNDDAEFFDAIRDLATASGVNPGPSIEIASQSQSTDGQAFGFPNHYALRLGGKFRLLFRKRPDQFRAVVLHEMAHIANGDISRTYFAQAIWTAMIILVVIPSITLIIIQFLENFNGKETPLASSWLRSLFTELIPTVFLLLLQFVGTLAIIAAIHGSLLRIREIYADWRAVLWGASTPLVEILRRNARVEKFRVLKLWSLHPSPQERLAALEDPSRLFRVKVELPLFVGVLLGYSFTGLIFVLGSLIMSLLVGAAVILPLQLSKVSNNPMVLSATMPILQYSAYAISIGIVIIFGFCLTYFIAGALGVEIQREATVDLINNRRGPTQYFRLLKPSTYVAVGFFVGILLTPKSFLANISTMTISEGLVGFPLLLVITIAILILTWIWLIYARYFGRRLFGAYTSTTPPRRMHRLSMFILAGVLLVLYIPITYGVSLLDLAFIGGLTLLDPLIGIFFLLIVSALVLFAVIFGLTWIGLKVFKLKRDPRCPSCKIIIPQRYTVGYLCKRCGQDLAAWLFVP